LTSPKLRSLTVQGFRAYGAEEQTLNLPSDLAAVWAPNSQGKTSLAEAFEFLLTGRIARRELMASSQAEFAGALRNVHIAPATPVYVSAKLIGADGSPHEIKRTLVSDYEKNQDCQSRLEIDGVREGEDALASLGIILSQPPLAAPVLAQHTLSYIFSVRPQDRSTYFKALLEVTDLDQLRNDIARLAGECIPPNDPLLTKFDGCGSIPGVREIINKLQTTVPDVDSITAQIADAAEALIVNAGEPVPSTNKERLNAVETILTNRRAKTFPVKHFHRIELSDWTAPSVATWDSLDTYLIERQKIDAETRRLVSIFNEALKLPSIAAISGAIDCPLCGTEGALTPERVASIRDQLANATGFKAAEAAAKTALTQLSISAANFGTAAAGVTPAYLQQTAKQRRAEGFSLDRIRALIGSRADDLLSLWLARLRPLKRAIRELTTKAKDVRALVTQYAAKLETDLDPTALRIAFTSIESLRASLLDAVNAYNTPAQSIRTTLNQTIDAQSNTSGWQDFIDIAPDPAALRTALIERKARATVSTELQTALRQIDHAKEQVLDDKFSDYSNNIQEWWERLRPGEATFFASVKPRPGARRTIDFKAALSPTPDRLSPKTRDVIAVFSQSQLHCLGLALFLARAQNEGLGFIILDDPVLSSDEDYRGYFNTDVIEKLLALPIQVVVLTQDNKTWKELQVRYRHMGVSNAQLFIDTPLSGTTIENTSDALLEKLSRAKSLARGGHPHSRKECGIQLRDAGELFCKEMLVNDERAKGKTSAALTDYDGKTLDWLCPRVQPLSTTDPSHAGKLEAFKNTVNSACHDDIPPGTGQMTHACGEIQCLIHEYLPSYKR